MGIYSSICYHLPLFRRKIVFANFNGRGWGGAPKYIAQEIIRQRLHYDLVWLVNEPNLTFPPGIRPVSMFSRRGKYELSTAKIIVNNTKHKLPFKKKKGQYYIQTWHGDFALKYIEKEIEEKLDPRYVSGSKQDSLETDLVLAGSEQFKSIVKSAFYYNGEIMDSGCPCNDLFFSNNQELASTVRSHFGIPPDVRVCLYAPTFRDGRKDFSLPDFEILLSLLKGITSKHWTILVRFHSNDLKRMSLVNYSPQIINASFYSDTQELSVLSDLLITDYSSIMYDFALQRKPVVLFTPDISSYQQIRGLRDIYWDVPFPRACIPEDIKYALESAFKDEYYCQLDLFIKEKVRSFDDGYASERVVSRIKDVINGREYGR